MYFKDGKNYTGQFDKGYMNGKGQIFWPNGLSFDGNFENDSPNGYGIMTYPSGHYRRGVIIGKEWQEKTEFVDVEDNSIWTEFWEDGSYAPMIKLSKRRIDKKVNILFVLLNKY